MRIAATRDPGDTAPHQSTSTSRPDSGDGWQWVRRCVDVAPAYGYGYGGGYCGPGYGYYGGWRPRPRYYGYY